MGIMDNIKRSLGFEETESAATEHNDDEFINRISDNISNLFNNISKPSNNDSRPQSTPKPPENHTNVSSESYSPHPRPTPISDDDYVITPERSFYEIVLIRPKSIDDVNYIVDQVVGEKNPVIVDLSFLEKDSEPNFKLAGEKIKYMRSRHDAQAVLLDRNDEKNLILLSPRKVTVINKG